jgi:hypothetical protein
VLPSPGMSCRHQPRLGSFRWGSLGRAASTPGGLRSLLSSVGSVAFARLEPSRSGLRTGSGLPREGSINRIGIGLGRRPQKAVRPRSPRTRQRPWEFAHAPPGGTARSWGIVAHGREQLRLWLNPIVVVVRSWSVKGRALVCRRGREFCASARNGTFPERFPSRRTPARGPGRPELRRGSLSRFLVIRRREPEDHGTGAEPSHPAEPPLSFVGALPRRPGC